MQKRTLTRFDEIVRVFRKYDFDKLLGKTTRNHLNPFKNDDDNRALLEDDFPDKSYRMSYVCNDKHKA